MEEKQNLNLETRRRYILHTIKHGLSAVVDTKAAKLKLLAVVLAWIGICKLWAWASPDFAQGMLHTSQLLLSPLVIVAALYWAGYVPGSWDMYRNLVRVGLVNSAGEAPYLIGRREVDGQTEYIFQSRGVTKTRWNELLEEVESALNLTIGSIRQSTDFRTLTIRAVPPNVVFGQTIMWGSAPINYDDASDFILGKTAAGEIVRWNCETMPHVLIGGATSSGKTRLSMLILEQAILRGAHVYIIDLKGLDYRLSEEMDARLVTNMQGAVDLLNETVEAMYKRRDLLRKMNAVNFSEYNRKAGSHQLKQIFILIDECSMLTNSGTSKEAKAASQECIDKITTLVRLGRAVGIHLLIATQVPDVSSVPTAIRANLDMRICGKADSILSTMVLGDGSADELIPKDARGRFVMANGAESVVFQAYYYDR